MKSSLSTFLDDYFGHASPGYAILVTGVWGVGKTHQIKNCMNDDCKYVSLFGLKTDTDVHNAVRYSINPGEKYFDEIDKYTERMSGSSIIANVVLSLPGIARESIRYSINANTTIIFDDFERCGLCMESILGIVSHYLENIGVRVVLVADYNRLVEKYPEFPTHKERVVGRTIHIEPSVNEVFEAFISHYAEKENAVFQRYKNAILKLYNESGCNSLRVLRQMLWSLSRLVAALDSEIIENEDAMKETIKLFCAIDIEIQTGNLLPRDLLNRYNTVSDYITENRTSTEIDVKPPNMYVVARKYKEVDVLSATLSDKALHDMFGSRQFKEEEIKRSLNASKHFLESVKTFPWSLSENGHDSPNQA